MVHDYAKRSSSQPRRKKHIVATVVIIVVAMALPAIMYFVKFKKMHTQKKASTATTKPTIIKPVSVHKPNSIQPEFDFYQILPKMEVKVPQQQGPIKHSYLLQVASFQDIQDAKHLKNELTALGYAPSIEAFQASDNRIWNRVLIGPFHSLSDAENAQDELRQQRLESLLLRIK